LETVLSISNLTKHFGRIKAVTNLNLEVKAGQVFGMLGPNGSGKTTTLGMLMGVVNPTSGSFSWFGEKPNHHVRKKIGAVLEHPIFYPYLSGQKNLELNAMIKQCDPGNISNVLELVELAERRDDKYKTYSLGMKQRLAIASALLNDPTVLILDEPTNGLDPMGIAEIRGLIQKIAQQGKTIILASHLLDEVQKVCSHFAVLRRGKKIYNGGVQEALHSTNSIAVGADNMDALKNVLSNNRGILSITDHSDGVLIDVSNDWNAASLNTYLVEHKIAVHFIQQKKSSLEEKFLEILRENDSMTSQNISK
jgi:ABC-type multidrug transport system ATPase subunit